MPKLPRAQERGVVEAHQNIGAIIAVSYSLVEACLSAVLVRAACLGEPNRVFD